MGIAAIIDNLNRSIARTTFGRVFRLEGSGHVSPSLLASYSLSNRLLTLEIPGEGDQRSQVLR